MTVTLDPYNRLGRAVKGLIELVEQLKAKGVEFRSLTDGIDTSTSAGRFFFHVDILPALSLRLPFFEREVRGFHQDSQKVDLHPSRTTTCALRDVC